MVNGPHQIAKASVGVGACVYGFPNYLLPSTQRPPRDRRQPLQLCKDQTGKEDGWMDVCGCLT